ncbi:MAG TPA: diaminopimelate decarboxylase [Candidatus Acidoferrales bacterium]|nr:diaminopimelate decarboxylase [Candidatus Acidoferrales bacterium]
MIRPTAYAYRRVSPRAPAELCCDAVPLAQLAEKYGTPLYVYAAGTIRARLRAFADAFRGVPHTLCYAVKANPALAILRLVAREGHGFDVVSGGELERIRRVSRTAARSAVFSGVGKTRPEMELALRSGVLLFNVESASELDALAETAARTGRVARVAIRVNPDLPAKTHPYISTGLRRHKFGVPIPEAERLYARAAQHPKLRLAGVSVHIGSQITDAGSFTAALERVAALVLNLRAQGHTIEYVDAGGGLAIPYEGAGQDFRRQLTAYARAVLRPLRGLGVHLLLEPGRSIVGPAGVLLTRVIYRKSNHGKRFLIVDAGMNDLLRPALYSAHHEIIPVVRGWTPHETTDVVGPVCETGDFLARDRVIPVVPEGGLLAILDTGAYGASQGSNYNTRGKPPEVLVDGKTARCIRRRESAADQMRLERV